MRDAFDPPIYIGGYENLTAPFGWNRAQGLALESLFKIVVVHF